MTLGESERLWASEQQHDGELRLSIGGELDLSTAGALRERLERARARGCSVRLDLSELAFVDSSGLKILLLAAREFRASGLGFGIEERLQPQVVRLLRLVRVHDLLIDDR